MNKFFTYMKYLVDYLKVMWDSEQLFILRGCTEHCKKCSILGLSSLNLLGPCKHCEPPKCPNKLLKYLLSSDIINCSHNFIDLRNT